MPDQNVERDRNAPPTIGYARQIGLFSATMMVVGGIIGAGIFLNPAIVAQRVGTAAATMATWSIGALIAIVGAFVFSELGARAPRAGGGYVYLRDAFGPFAAFLYGWALFLMISTGAIAAVAMTCASYATALMGLPPSLVTPLAVGAIVLLTGVNILGVTPGAITQNVATVLKLSAIAFLVIVAFVAPDMASLAPSAAGATSPVVPTLVVPAGFVQWIVAVSAALVPVLFAFGGWQQTNFIAEELRDPARDLPRALVLGVLIVVACYLLVNLSYLRALGVTGLAASRAPAADTVGALLGDRGRAVIGAGIVISTFGFLNLVILVTPRVYQAMAAEVCSSRGWQSSIRERALPSRRSSVRRSGRSCCCFRGATASCSTTSCLRTGCSSPQLPQHSSSTARRKHAARCLASPCARSGILPQRCSFSLPRPTSSLDRSCPIQ